MLCQCGDGVAFRTAEDGGGDRADRDASDRYRLEPGPLLEQGL
jgi:hypothetical protein